MPTTLVVMAGLPCSGKSTIAGRLATALALPVVSVDPIESAMWAGGIPRELTGVAAYVVSQAVAREQLRLGLSVIVDAVNPVEEAREMWRALVREQGATLRIVECVCSDLAAHRERVAARRRNIPGMDEVTWERVEERRRVYEPWTDDRLVLDTVQGLDELAAAAVAYVRDAGESP